MMTNRTVSQVWNDVSYVLYKAAENLTSGRKAFAETYGTGVDTKAVNLAIQDAFNAGHDRFLDGESEEVTVALPIHLVLAITLRKGVRDRGRPKTATQRRRALGLAMRNAPDFISRNRALRMSKGAAREKAIEQLANRFHLDPNIIRNEMRSPKSKSRK